MNRIVQVIRVQRPAWPWMIGWPWGMTAAAFGINLLVFTAIQDQMDGDATTGGLASLYGIAVGMAAVSVTQIFPYALGMSVTRRHFYLTWSLLAVVQAVAYALVLTLLHAAERIGRWLLDQSPVALAAGWPLLATAAFALGGYALIRRATA